MVVRAGVDADVSFRYLVAQRPIRHASISSNHTVSLTV